MRALGLATVIIGATFAAAPANAAGFVVEYSCRSDNTLVQLAAARNHTEPRLFQARVRHAVFAGKCKIVRFHSRQPTKSARRAVKPRKVAAPVVAPVKAVTYVPAGTVRPIRVSYAAPTQRYGQPERFPGPPLFMPVR
jgi:hypothetical protein